MIQLVLAFVAGLADLVGGVLPFHPRFKSIDIRYLVGFASGTVIAAAFFEMLPEADLRRNAPFLLMGFFTFYILEKGVMLHSCEGRECEAHTFGWVAVIGMMSDNIVDGMGIAIGYATDPLLGLVITVAVVAHEIPQGVTTTIIMEKAGFGRRRIIPVLIAQGLFYPIGAAASVLVPEDLYLAMIAFVAGDFLYIGAGDLLPEVHRRFNLRVIASVSLGALMMLGLEAVA